MSYGFSLSALIVASLVATAPHAETIIRAQMFKGDLCATDADPEGGLDDCATIPGNVGITGVYDLLLYGLDPNPHSDAVVRITSPYADLYGGEAQNNSDENFGLMIDGMWLGWLFDGSTRDEAEINPSLAASVERNISAADASAAPLDLIFMVPIEDLRPMVADGVLSLRFDFREDLNVNAFDDLSVLVSYEIAPTANPSLTEDVARLTEALAAQATTIESLSETLRGLVDAGGH